MSNNRVLFIRNNRLFMNLKAIRNYLFPVICLFFMLLPPTDNLITDGKDYIINVIRISVCAYALYKYNVKIPKYIILLCLFEFEFIIAAVVNGTTFSPFLYFAFRVVPVAVYTVAEMRQNQRRYLYACLIVLSCFATIHLIDISVNRAANISAGFDGTYYLGTDNQATSFFFALIFVATLYMSLYKKDVLALYGIVVSVYVSIVTQCGTAIIAYGLVGSMLVLAFIPNIGKKIVHRFNYKVFLCLHIGITLFLFSAILFRGFSFLAPIISLITGKKVEYTMTFTGRTSLWAVAFSQILSHPFWGLGFPSDGTGVVMWGRSQGAHNQILQWGVYGGLVSIAIFYALLICAVKKTNNYRDNDRYIALVTLLGYMLALSMELFFQGTHLFLMLSILYSLSYRDVKTRSKMNENRKK